MLWRDRYMRRLTHRMAVLGALRNGREMSIHGIASACGITGLQAARALQYLAEKGKVQSRHIHGMGDHGVMWRLQEDA